MVADDGDRRALDTIRQNPAPLAATALPRPTPEVGAECVGSARSDLSGGPGVTRVPTGMGVLRLDGKPVNDLEQTAQRHKLCPRPDPRRTVVKGAANTV